VYKLKGTIEEDLIVANSKNEYEISDKDLPLHCPLPGMYLWNSHPKVYLPLDENGKAMCHYCGASFILRN
tara:strand:- start:713 stop:922 length:210 start_codon:yes stop_codon:yes gene_type:complete